MLAVSLAVTLSVRRPVSGVADDGAMNIPAPPYINRALVIRLQSEWQLLRRRPTIIRRAQGWSLGFRFDDLDQVLAATDYWSTPVARAEAACGGSTLGDGNTVVKRLLLAGRHDTIAARVVLQRLLPGLISRARCWGPQRPGGSHDAFDEMLSAAWSVIREFPFERRPNHLVANLLRDSEYWAFGRTARRKLVHEFTEPRLLDLPVDQSIEAEPMLELAALIADAGSCVLSEHDRQLLTILANGASPTQAARKLQISERTLRYHRDAAVSRLRSAVLAA